MNFSRKKGKTLLVLDGSNSNPEISRIADFSEQSVGKLGEGRPISIYRKHMSEMGQRELFTIILECLKDNSE